MAYKIGDDKKKHFFAGIPLGALLQFSLLYFFQMQSIWATIFSMALLVAICYGFELFSLLTGKGHADNMDAIAGIPGGIIGITVCWCIYFLI